MLAPVSRSRKREGILTNTTIVTLGLPDVLLSLASIKLTPMKLAMQLSGPNHSLAAEHHALLMSPAEALWPRSQLVPATEARTSHGLAWLMGEATSIWCLFCVETVDNETFVILAEFRVVYWSLRAAIIPRTSLHDVDGWRDRDSCRGVVVSRLSSLVTVGHRAFV
jgi:hypothetical protein